MRTDTTYFRWGMAFLVFLTFDLMLLERRCARWTPGLRVLIGRCAQPGHSEFHLVCTWSSFIALSRVGDYFRSICHYFSATHSNPFVG